MKHPASSEITKENVRQNSVSNSGIHVTPNPNVGMFTIELESDATINKDIFVYDMTGRPVWQKTNTSESSFKIDISDRPRGMYTVKVAINGQVSFNKIVYL